MSNENIKQKIQNLINAANNKTGQNQTNLTDAFKTLLEGYGVGSTPEIDLTKATAMADKIVAGYSAFTASGLTEGTMPVFDEKEIIDGLQDFSGEIIPITEFPENPQHGAIYAWTRPTFQGVCVKDGEKISTSIADREFSAARGSKIFYHTLSLYEFYIHLMLQEEGLFSFCDSTSFAYDYPTAPLHLYLFPEFELLMIFVEGEPFSFGKGETLFGFGTFRGVITSLNEATEDGLYAYAPVKTEYYQCTLEPEFVDIKVLQAGRDVDSETEEENLYMPVSLWDMPVFVEDQGFAKELKFEYAQTKNEITQPKANVLYYVHGEQTIYVLVGDTLKDFIDLLPFEPTTPEVLVTINDAAIPYDPTEENTIIYLLGRFMLTKMEFENEKSYYHICASVDNLPGFAGPSKNSFASGVAFFANKPTLNTPTISIEGDTLTITDNPDNGNFTSGFDIFVNNNKKSVTNENTYDLSSLNLAAGEYNISVAAQGANFYDSPASESAVYVVEETPEITGGTE